MYAVIFSAELINPDNEYFATAEKLRGLAKLKYHCLDIVSVTEGKQEITISYWKSESHILEWKQDPEHQRAQELGRNRWYSTYKVQIAEVKREY